MLRSVHQLDGCTIAATDGDIGKVVDVYFDDEKWAVRYLVVDTGGWLTGRKVLISPVALQRVDWEAGKVRASLSREQVENSPAIDTDKPVSRQHETQYYGYYHYPVYWTGPFLWGPGSLPRADAMSGSAETEARARLDSEASEDVHLRSAKAVTGYTIEARDGEIGHVEDFIIDDENWTIRYIAVDTVNWWPAKKVLVSPEWISSVSWSESRVYVDVSRETIKQAPEYDLSKPVGREYEERLYRHYGRPRYWPQRSGGDQAA